MISPPTIQASLQRADPGFIWSKGVGINHEVLVVVDGRKFEFAAHLFAVPTIADEQLELNALGAALDYYGGTAAAKWLEADIETEANAHVPWFDVSRKFGKNTIASGVDFTSGSINLVITW